MRRRTSAASSAMSRAGRDVTNPMPLNGHAPPLLDTLASTTQWLFGLPSTLTSAAFDSLAIARQSMLVGDASRYGDGKPIVLVPPHLGCDLALLPLSAWLKALGYRPANAGLILNLGDVVTDRTPGEIDPRHHHAGRTQGRAGRPLLEPAAGATGRGRSEGTSFGCGRVRRDISRQTKERRSHAFHLRVLADTSDNDPTTPTAPKHRHRIDRSFGIELLTFCRLTTPTWP